MEFKSRTESIELQILKYLNLRMNLSSKDSQHLFNLMKGYEGEVKFDSLTKNLECECLILNDLLLQTNSTLFQIDSLIILSDRLYLFEVKNHDGDYYYESERLYKTPKVEVMNPLNQINRTETLFRQLLQDLHVNLPIDSKVVFINPEFTLYQAPLNKPFIFQTQVYRYLTNLNAIPSKLNKKHKALADKLVSLHITDSPFKQLPEYDYAALKKGITCVACHSFAVNVVGKNCVCSECGHREVVEDAVLRSVKEFKLLFPNEKITTTAIHNWCLIVRNQKRIRRILNEHFKITHCNRWTYFE